MTRQNKPMTAQEAERAERAYVLCTYDQREYTEIAEQLGYEGTSDRWPAEVAQQAVERFGEEIKAGLRSAPPEPKRRRRRAP